MNIINLKMSTTKTITLSMESLNKLYFQFFDRFVTPNLTKSINEITQLLRNRTAYDVYKYLQELVSKGDSSEGYTSNQIINSLNSSINSHSVNSIANTASLYQYALPTNGENSKSAHTEHHKNYDKVLLKESDDSMNFKNKLGIRRTLTGLAYEQPPKGLQYRNYSEETNHSPSIYTNPLILTNDLKSDFSSKDPLSLIPTLTPNTGKLDFVLDDTETKSKTMKEMVRKISKIFNDNHSKIEKYNKSSSETNKLFNINNSTRLDKKEEGRIKQYQFHPKSQLNSRKY